jgi:hypothetical protein
VPSKMLDLDQDRRTFAVVSAMYRAGHPLYASDISQDTSKVGTFVAIDPTNARLRRLADAGFAYRLPGGRVRQWTLTPFGQALFEQHVGRPEPSGWCVYDRGADVWHAIPAGLGIEASDGTDGHADWVPILCGRVLGEGINLPGPFTERDPSCPACKG